MAANEAEIERDIQAAGKTGPRLTPADIDRVIVSVTYACPVPYFTVCVLTLKNGFHVTGESAAASPENYDEGIGKRIAYENARQKIWPLEGYLLRARLADLV